MTSVFSRKAVQSIANTIRPMSSFVKISQVSEYVARVEISRADKRNAMNKEVLSSLEHAFDSLASNPDCRAIVLSGDGKCFTAGVDLKFLMGMSGLIAEEEDIARKAAKLRPFIVEFQRSMHAPVRCSRPVIAAVHGACIGAGVDLVSGADIRLCSADAFFQIKEVDVGLAADVGTLARLTKIVGSESWAREVCFTARTIPSAEALSRGFVSAVYPDKVALMEAALDMANQIASKSPIAVQGTKFNMEYALNHTTDESLDYIATWNMSMLMSEDLIKSAAAQLDSDGEKPVFSKL